MNLELYVCNPNNRPSRLFLDYELAFNYLNNELGNIHKVNFEYVLDEARFLGLCLQKTLNRLED